MSRNDYQRGLSDGKAIARSESEALKGADRTLYEFIGGPKHGERVETEGTRDYFVAMMPPMSYRAYDDFRMPPFGDLIQRGRYERRDIFTAAGKRRTVYMYQGES